MYKNSFKGEYLDESKIKFLVTFIVKNQVQALPKILKAYKRLIGTQAAKERVVIETPLKLDTNLEKSILFKTKAKKLEYQLNPDLVAGAKITHGDWIWDSSLDSKLDQLKAIN